MPRSYPRHVQEKEESIISTVAAALGGVGAAATLLTVIITYNQRKRPVFVFAQVEFVFLLLFGLLLVSTGAVLTALPPTNLRCVFTAWLVNIGYSFELVPLVVKIFAINSLMQAAKRMKRIQLGRKLLFGAVAVLTGLVVVYMIFWTVFDPPVRRGNFQLTEVQDDSGSTVVSVAYYCQSKSEYWTLVSVGAQGLLLLCASVLSFMTRRMQRKDVNETNTISFLIYWNFVCVLLRGILLLLGDTIDVGRLNRSMSMILTADTIATILIYFLPKFMSKDEPNGSDYLTTAEVWRPSGRHSTTASILATRGSIVGRPGGKSGGESRRNEENSTASPDLEASHSLRRVKFQANNADSENFSNGNSGNDEASELVGAAADKGDLRTASDEDSEGESKPESERSQLNERVKSWGLTE